MKYENIYSLSSNITKIMSGGVLLWMNADETEIILKNAANRLKVRTTKAEIKSIEFYGATPDAGKIVSLPDTIEGYDVEITWGEITMSNPIPHMAVIECAVTATISCPWTDKAEIRTFKTAYWKGM